MSIAYYDRQGHRMVDPWSSQFDDIERRVAKTEVIDPDRNVVDVSTVWLGLDHNFSGIGPPLIFETMIFVKKGDCPVDQVPWRYATEEKAVAGHAYVVDKARRGDWQALEEWGGGVASGPVN